MFQRFFFFVFVRSLTKVLSSLVSTTILKPCWRESLWGERSVDSWHVMLFLVSSAKRAIMNRKFELPAKPSTNIVTRSPPSLRAYVEAIFVLTCFQHVTWCFAACLLCRTRANGGWTISSRKVLRALHCWCRDYHSLCKITQCATFHAYASSSMMLPTVVSALYISSWYGAQDLSSTSSHTTYQTLFP